MPRDATRRHPATRWRSLARDFGHKPAAFAPCSRVASNSSPGSQFTVPFANSACQPNAKPNLASAALLDVIHQHEKDRQSAQRIYHVEAMPSLAAR
jgi:hypothetical protein